MLPNKNSWRSLSVAEKVSYIANLTVPVTLMVTIIFSYLAYREARLTREQEAVLFLAQNAPRVRVDSVEVDKDVLWVNAMNIGSSVAQKVCIVVFYLGERAEFANTCDTGVYSNVSLQSDELRGIPVFSFHDKDLRFTRVPKEAIKREEPSAKSKEESLIIVIRFSDIAEKPYDDLQAIELVY